MENNTQAQATVPVSPDSKRIHQIHTSASERKAQLRSRIGLGDGIAHVALIGGFLAFWIYAAFQFFS